MVEHAQVLRAADALFTRTGRLDMDELARAVAVSRATLYRVVRSRDLLLGEVLWQKGRATTLWAERTAQGSGADRLVHVARLFNERVVADESLRTLLQEDPATAFRVLFGPEVRVHVRFVELWRGVLQREVDAGTLALGLDLDALAYVFVRVGESIIYADLLGGRQPDLDVAEVVQRALLAAGTPPA